MGFDVQRNLANQNVNVSLQAMLGTSKEAQKEKAERQESTELSAKQDLETETPGGLMRKVETSIKAAKTRIQKMMKASQGKKLLPIQQLKEMAGQFQRRNPELLADTLVLLRQRINADDSKEKILSTLLEFYPDISLADEALEYLLKTSDGELASKLREIKEELNEQRGREIIAGRNIQLQAKQAAEKGLGTPSTMRDMYRDITGNPRSAAALFEELSKKYAYKDMKKVTDFLLNSLGADMKSKGPSIEPAELQRLFSETRNLQAVLGVYRFFRNRMPLMQSLFEKNNLTMPPTLSFESISKEFIGYISERYPSASKALQHIDQLGVGKMLAAKVIALAQFRDGIREVSLPKIFGTSAERDKYYLPIIEASEDVEDEIEQLEERGEEGPEESIR